MYDDILLCFVVAAAAPPNVVFYVKVFYYNQDLILEEHILLAEQLGTHLECSSNNSRVHHTSVKIHKTQNLPLKT